MKYAIGTITKSGGTDCHRQMIPIIKTLMESNSWVTQRYVTDEEWIGKSQGLSGTEEIFLGVKAYESVNSDVYNMDVATFTGYIPQNTFETQPGIGRYGVFSHNNAITYYLSANAQMITGCLKVGTPVYSHFYIGKALAYARPTEYPAPLVVGGMVPGGELTRFSDPVAEWPYHSPNNNTHLSIRNANGSYITPAVDPFTGGGSSGGSTFLKISSTAGCVPVQGLYLNFPMIISDFTFSQTVERRNVYGELQNVYGVSGFNNGPENVQQEGGSSVVDQSGMTPLQAVQAIHAVNGRAFVVLQNVARTRFCDFLAMEMVA